MTPTGWFSAMGVVTGVAGTDLLAVDCGPLTADGTSLTGVGSVTLATADVSVSGVGVTLVAINCRPGIGRAGGAEKFITNRPLAVTFIELK